MSLISLSGLWGQTVTSFFCFSASEFWFILEGDGPRFVLSGTIEKN